LKLKPYWTHFLPLAIWVVTIFIASSLPTNAIVSQDILDYDKLIHLGVYFVLGILVYRVLHLDSGPVWLRSQAVFYTLLFTALYGASDEFHQYFVPGRSMEFFDWLADALGGLLAIGAFALVSRLRPRPEARN
jgi:VanZ family protein